MPAAPATVEAKQMVTPAPAPAAGQTSTTRTPTSSQASPATPKPDADAAHLPTVLAASAAQPATPLATAAMVVATAETKPAAPQAHLPAAIPTSASIQSAAIPIRTTCPVQPCMRDNAFVGPMPPPAYALTGATVVAAAPADAAAKNNTAGATKGAPADDSWHLGDWCQDAWGEFSNWATREPVVTANVGMDILKPYWKSNPAFSVVSNTSPVLARVTDFDFSMQAVPQFTLGVMGSDNFGVRFGWWGFAAQNSQVTPVAAAGLTAGPLGLPLTAVPGQGIIADSKLRFDVWDFEAFELFHPCRWSLLVSGGIRYAHLSQDYTAVVGGGSGGTFDLLSGHNFNGAGPTLSVGGKRPLGDSNLYVYGNLRGSVLFGSGQQTAADNLGVGNIIQATDDVLPEAELEIGLGWYRALGQAQFFAQVGLVSQVWIDAGNSSRSEITPTVLSQTDATLGLLGLSMRVGVNY